MYGNNNKHAFIPFTVILATALLLSACDFRSKFGDAPVYNGEEAEALVSSDNSRDFSVTTLNVLNYIQHDLPISLTIAVRVIALIAPASEFGTSALVELPITRSADCSDSGTVNVTPAISLNGDTTQFIIEYLNCDENGTLYNGGLNVTFFQFSGSFSSVVFAPKNLTLVKGQENSLFDGRIEIHAVEGEAPSYWNVDLIQVDLAREYTYQFQNFLYENSTLTGTIHHSIWGFVNVDESNFVNERVTFRGSNGSSIFYSISDKPTNNYLDWLYQIEVDADGNAIYESSETITGAVLFAY